MYCLVLVRVYHCIIVSSKARTSQPAEGLFPLQSSRVGEKTGPRTLWRSLPCRVRGMTGIRDISGITCMSTAAVHTVRPARTMPLSALDARACDAPETHGVALESSRKTVPLAQQSSRGSGKKSIRASDVREIGLELRSSKGPFVAMVDEDGVLLVDS